MSAVRMCDRCGNIFSEREDGWTTLTGTQVKRDSNGQQRNISEQIDTCADCTLGPAVQPRLALSSATGIDRVARTGTSRDVSSTIVDDPDANPRLGFTIIRGGRDDA